MLSVAQAVHHPETPGSASKHSSLGHSWSSDRPRMLKRRKTDTECILDEKPTASIESITKQFHFDDNEITLTAIPKNQNQIHTNTSTFIHIQESTIHNSSQQDNVEDEQTCSTTVMSFLKNSEEVQLIKLTSNDNKKMHLTENSDDISNNSEISTSKLKQKSSPLNPIAELSEVTIEPYQKSQHTSLESVNNEKSMKSNFEKIKIPTRLVKAQEFLKNKEAPIKVPFVSSSTNETFDTNLKSTASEAQAFNLDHCSKTELEEIFGSNDFDKPPFTHGKSSMFEANSEHQMSVPNVTDYEPFNVGVSCDCFYTNIRDRPYYTTGFPNPPSENRCWINSTLQALFALPIMNDLYSMDTTQYSKLMSSLVNVYTFWQKGNTSTCSFDQTFNTFKEELSVLDKLYSSKAQQDVSEFIMNLLNFIKSEFESILKKESHNTEIENIPNNEQDTPRRLQNAVVDSNKRLPLADISTTTMQLRSNNQLNSKTNSSAMKLKNESQLSFNPVDEYFSFYMVENLVCNNCQKIRQQKVENLTLFVDLPSDDHGTTVDLVEMINTTYGTEQRNIKCESCDHDSHSMDTKLKRPPKILTVQVKRYEMTNDGLITKKSSLVDIPKQLKLHNLVINSEEINYIPEYEPICIISHIGDNIDSGHYISFVKHQDQWFYYDDINVKLLNPEEVFKCVQNNAYVVFFQDTELSQSADNLTDQRNKTNTTC